MKLLMMIANLFIPPPLSPPPPPPPENCCIPEIENCLDLPPGEQICHVPGAK